MASEMEEVKEEIETVRQDIKTVEQQIKTVEQNIHNVEEEAKTATNDEVPSLKIRQERLWKKEEQLRQEKDRLRQEKDRLRLKELVLLKAEKSVSAVASGMLDRIEKLERKISAEAPWKVRVSEISSSEWARIEADIHVKSGPYLHLASGPLETYQPRKPWKKFEWDASQTERQQSSEYLRHLKEYVDVESTDHGFAGVAADKNFLSFSAFGRDIVGTADVAITAQSSAYLNPASGLRGIVELKKSLNSGKGLNYVEGYQAMISLLLANLKYPGEQLLALLTDLGQTWYIMWLDGDMIRFYLFNSADDAVGYLEHFLETAVMLRKNPSTKIEPSGLDSIWGAKRQSCFQRLRRGNHRGKEGYQSWMAC